MYRDDRTLFQKVERIRELKGKQFILNDNELKEYRDLVEKVENISPKMILEELNKYHQESEKKNEEIKKKDNLLTMMRNAYIDLEKMVSNYISKNIEPLENIRKKIRETKNLFDIR